MATVTVTFDPNASPRFKFDQDPLEIDTGLETIHWKPADSTFTLVALVFNKQNPFCDVVVNRDGSEITARDSNQSPDRHPYSVLVKYQGTYYNSFDDGARGKGRKKKGGGVGNGGGPTIKNN